MVLPEGVVVPPWYYLVPLALVLLGAGALLLAIDPPVTDRTVIAFAPWMMLGSTLHVLYRIDGVSTIVEPLFSSPTVYGTAAAAAGLVWIVATLVSAAGLHGSVPRMVGLSGVAAFTVFAGVAVMRGYETGSFDPFWPVLAVVVAGVVATVAWIALSLRFTDVAAATGLTGAFVVFSQTLDGVSTAIGYDLLGAGEDVPLSMAILEAGDALPTDDYVGAGWLFVVVKVALACAVVGLFANYVRERPRRARLLLALVAALGLGPAVHNLLLFTVS